MEDYKNVKMSIGLTSNMECPQLYSQLFKNEQTTTTTKQRMKITGNKENAAVHI